MDQGNKDTDQLRIGDVAVNRGRTRDINLKISETYTSDDITMPIRVIRAKQPGPVIFVSAAVHGDEINGTGIVHDLMFNAPPKLERGSLILIPVVNVFGFENNNRYMPDRRDLNRSFPGNAEGSLTSRMADVLMREIVRKCDYGIDLHTAAFQRTNYPNVRADLRDPAVRDLATAFGCALVVDGKGPEGSLRRAACQEGVPTIILEAGEPYKIEPSVLEIGVQGIHNILIHLGMIEGQPVLPPYEARITKTTWVRASLGGILRFHVSAGDLVEAGQALASNYSIMGNARSVITSPVDGIILGMATMPAVKPGEPICHIAIPNRKLRSIRRCLEEDESSSHQLAYRHLSTNITVTRPPRQFVPDAGDPQDAF
ncbi:MAG: M14 family metallopeptidase [Verrucomicrobia bacterium]|nr:M14 family metallopeptidase [Verrucomicrobiota bacterium]